MRCSGHGCGSRAFKLASSPDENVILVLCVPCATVAQGQGWKIRELRK